MAFTASGQRRRSLGVRARQVAFVAFGIAVAAVMCVLGLWQMQRSIDSGDAGIAARAALAPVPLLDHVRPDGTFDDIYGKPVTVTGTYVPGQQVLVSAADGSVRVLAALRVADGRVVPIVRGVASSRDAVPPAPSGERTETGLFLPGEGDGAAPAASGAPSMSGAPALSGELASVRMPLLAQLWPQQLTPGFVTLAAAGSAAQGLGAASVTLPHGEKSLQNGSYAIQWWLFAACALGIGLKLAHSAGASGDEESAVSPPPVNPPPAGPPPISPLPVSPTPVNPPPAGPLPASLGQDLPATGVPTNRQPPS